MEEMIHSFMGINFNGLYVFDVAETILSENLRKTVREVTVAPDRSRGEWLDLKRTMIFSVNDFTAVSSFLDFDLSQNEPLRTLEITAGAVDRVLENGSLEAASEFLKRSLSTIKSPDFYRVLLVYN